MKKLVSCVENHIRRWSPRDFVRHSVCVAAFGFLLGTHVLPGAHVKNRRCPSRIVAAFLFWGTLLTSVTETLDFLNIKFNCCGKV